jgi:phosphoribosyl-ATP pyrophosphohydrolase/phosphoribosyl-AMP cyclohydrolase
MLIGAMSPLPIKFDAKGLVPAIVQDYITGDIRMFAFATNEAVRKTVETARATFWSRSRGELWQKGRVSGQVTPVVRVLADCDADCLIYSTDPQSPSCHSGAPSCFFQSVEPERLGQSSAQPQTILSALERDIEASRENEAMGLAKQLLEGGAAKVAATFREKADHFASAVEKESDERVVVEAADAVYHLLVGLRSRGVGLRRVLLELSRRVDHRGELPAAPPSAPPFSAR